MLWPTQLCVFSYIGGSFMPAIAQFIANRLNAQKSTSTRFLQMSLVNPADCFMRNKPNFRNAKMNINKVLTKDYGNKPPLRAPGKQTQSNPISIPICAKQSQFQYQICKTNPIKPNLVRHSLGDGGFKRGTHTALRPVLRSGSATEGGSVALHRMPDGKDKV